MADMTRQPDAGKLREAGAPVPQQAGDAGAEMIRGGAEVAQRAAEATGEIARRNEAATARMAEEAAARTASLAGAMAERTTTAVRAGGEAATEAVQGGAADLWRIMLPGGAGGMRELQAAILGAYADAARTNLRMAQDMLKLMDPAGLLQGQQKLAHQMLDALLACQAAMFGAARQPGEAATQAAERAR